MIYLVYELQGAIVVAFLLGVACGFAGRWLNRKRRRFP